MISKKKKKKKKKKVFAKIQSDFSAEIQVSNIFSAQNQVISKRKKKKKGLRQNSRRFFFQNFASSNVSGGALFAWGGYFQFFTENRPQKHKKHAILHTSQANGGARAPPAPPLATLLSASECGGRGEPNQRFFIARHRRMQ